MTQEGRSGSSQSIEAAREYIRERVRRSSLQVVATQAGVNKATLHQFVRKSNPGTPTGARREALLRFYEQGSRSEAAEIVSRDTNRDAPAGEKPVGAGTTPREAAARGPARSADYWEGVQYAIQRMLQQILTIQQEATELHRELVENTVPTPRRHPLGQPAPVGAAGPRRPKGAKKAIKKGGTRATG